MTNLTKRLVKNEDCDFTKEQKEKLMQFAVVDEDFVERCHIIQTEMENIDG